MLKNLNRNSGKFKFLFNFHFAKCINVLVPTANNFEEIELMSIVGILRRAQMKVDLVSITDNRTIRGLAGVEVRCDKVYDQISEKEYDLIVLAGGYRNANELSRHNPLITKLK